MCCHRCMKKLQSRIRLKDAVRVKCAEYWLKLGEWREALMELQQLPETAKQDPWVIKVFLSATGNAMKQNRNGRLLTGR